MLEYKGKVNIVAFPAWILLSSFLSSTLSNAFALRLFLLFLSYSRLQLKPFSQRVDSGPMLTPRGGTGKPVQPPGQAADTLPLQSGQASQQRVSPRRTQTTNPTAVFPEPQLTLTLKARAIAHRGTQQSHQDGLVSFAFPFSDFRHF
jgi:hypothetical protein